ncbi:restriction endonuclease subunit S [Mycoplasma sp. 4404]|uniref:restriction endonuclease subunit S n=1 Tax=Mycoplasma sp. 4404 TaxID=3108530 RepID=UPI002B1E0C29|nr:restriction endonuclease subunit S [Mycoplasma sp. 4404]MEA4162474.1 restriction endonuclease subunit S [Mycoplasma sp. 4404]
MKYGKGNNIPSTENGIYPVYGANGIVSYFDEYNNENSAIVGHIGSVGNVIWGDGKHFVTYNGTIIKGLKNIANDKFIYYLLSSMKLHQYQKGSQPFLSISDFSDVECILPSLETQNKIVDILDTFDTMCNNLKIGLPAEEARRQQQYEYYRNLIFDKLSDKNN